MKCPSPDATCSPQSCSMSISRGFLRTSSSSSLTRSHAMLKAVFASKSRMACSICGARALVSRSARPQFDACGFERCEFECRHCGAYFVGVVDPLDGANLVSAETPKGTFYQVIPRDKDAQQHHRSLPQRFPANHAAPPPTCRRSVANREA